MATRAIDELLPEVMVYVPNAPDPLVFRYIREAARKLCHDAKVVRQLLNITVATTGSQSFPTYPDVEFVEIEMARMNGRTLTPTTPTFLDGEHPGWERETGKTSARWITQLTPDTVILWPKETGTLQIRAVMQPSRNCITVDAELVDLYGTLVGRGAASQLMLLPGNDFTNPNLGAAMYSEFLAKVASLKIETVKGQQGAPLRTQGVWF